jgi:hypothetical protein
MFFFEKKNQTTLASCSVTLRGRQRIKVFSVFSSEKKGLLACLTLSDWAAR